MKIFINAGHGGTDPGAISKSGTQESEIAAKICGQLAEMLRLVWFSTEEFQQKSHFSEISQAEHKSGADLVVSVHCNSVADPSANGVEVYHFPTSTKGQKLAQSIQATLVKATGLRDRGVKPNNTFHVLQRTKAPAVLVECAFLSNPKEEKLLKEQPDLFALAIFEGIKNYCENELNFTPKVPVAVEKICKIEVLNTQKCNLYVDDKLVLKENRKETVVNYLPKVL
jgi:N-acetylmuramoyl-L-alanine amidase